MGFTTRMLVLGAAVFYIPWAIARAARSANPIRADEERRNLDASRPSRQQLAWHLVHIRDDMILLCLLMKVQIMATLLLIVLVAVW